MTRQQLIEMMRECYADACDTLDYPAAKDNMLLVGYYPEITEVAKLFFQYRSEQFAHLPKPDRQASP